MCVSGGVLFVSEEVSGSVCVCGGLYVLFCL